MDANYLKSFLTTLLALQFDYSAGQCSGSTLSLTATTSLQYISSPNYPSYYDNNLQCEWSITSSSDKVVFYVYSDDIENNYDYMRIYDGSMLYYSNKLYDSEYLDSPYVDVSPGSELIVTFDSDYSVTYGGFQIYYIAVSSLDYCGQTFTATTTAQQLTYIYNYANSWCEYTINSGNFVQITVRMVRNNVEIIEEGTSSFLYTVDSVYTSSSSSITVRGAFVNDFVITYEEVSSGSNIIMSTEPPVPKIECIGWFRITATDTVQFLTSESYPGAYPNNQFCHVIIETIDPNDSVYLYFNDYHVIVGDYLQLYDGPSTSYNQLYGLWTHSSYNSSGYALCIEFTTNTYSVGRGFNISFYRTAREDPLADASFTVTDVYDATSSPQTINSPNYPNSYDNNLDRYWLIIKPNQDDNIRLEFVTIDVENAVSCIYDKVTFYDGNFVTDPVLLVICGYDPTSIEDNSGLYILVRFESDASFTASGFQIDFYIGSVQSSNEGVEEGDTELPVWGWIVIIIVGVVVGIPVIACKIICRMSRTRVGTGNKDPPKVEKRTTQQLLTEVTNKYGAKINAPKKKVPRKTRLPDNRPQPNPSVNVTVVVVPHPPPNPVPNFPPNPTPQPFGVNDPVYPPLYVASGGGGPPSNITPVYTNIPQTFPTAPVNDPAYPAYVPSPYDYFTPSEARANGTYP